MGLLSGVCMAMYKRLLKITIVSLVLLTAFCLGCGWYVSNSVYSEDAMKKPNNFSNGRFTNAEPTTVMKPGSNWDLIYQFLFKGHKDRTPSKPLPVVSMDGFAQQQAADGLRFIWFGHSSVLVELDRKRILIDPVFSDRASLFSWAGPKRFQPAPIQAEGLPTLDAVLISHDHYDHLDKPTILAIAPKTASFHVPLGVAALLEQWGIPKSKIHEYAWWDTKEVDGIMIVATPARHFSGRGLFDRNRTLWCSWGISRNGRKVFHSGDTGMTSQFKEIGKKYGPFDLAFIKMAAYNENWPDIHLNPEQAVEAYHDLGGKTLVPIHWATFDLSLHSWYEPIERLVTAADHDHARVITPRMGELVDPEQYENGYWWKEQVSASK
jgi:L-ascorbate metabolism protein UlaG (beta-lactamase superfamily)